MVGNGKRDRNGVNEQRHEQSGKEQPVERVFILLEEGLARDLADEHGEVDDASSGDVEQQEGLVRAQEQATDSDAGPADQPGQRRRQEAATAVRLTILFQGSDSSCANHGWWLDFRPTVRIRKSRICLLTHAPSSQVRKW